MHSSLGNKSETLSQKKEKTKKRDEERNTEAKLHDTGLGNDFLNMTLKAQAAKVKLDEGITSN